jgi:hypothetical protein
MKKFKTFFLVLLFLGLISPNASFTLDLYDDFSGTFIDKSKWKWADWVREIDTGTGKLLLKHGSHNPNTASSFPYTTWNNLPFSNPNSVNSIQADITILQNQITGAAYTRTRLEGRWFNDGTAGGGYAGDIYAEVGIRWTGTEFRGYWWVGRYPGASDTVNQLGYGLFPTTLSIGVNYIHYIDYNSTANEFTFMIGSDSITFGTPSGLPPRVGNANNPWKSLTTRVQIDNQNSSAYISATFDNVYKNGVLYDNFSSPTINSANWTNYEFVREISGGKVRSKIRSSPATTSSFSSALEFSNPSIINAIQTKVTLLDFDNPQGTSPRARIAGYYYNDGTSGGGYIGDVGAQVRIGGSGTDPVGEWSVWKCTDLACNNVEALAWGTFITPVSVGGTYTLFLGWNGSQFALRLNNEIQSYVPTTTINPPNNPWRMAGTHIYNPSNKEATVEALFDDVMVEYIKNYDDFSRPLIDKEKWTRGEFVREIDAGSQKLLSKLASPNPVMATSFPYSESNWLSFPDPNSVDSIQADVAINQNFITNTAFTRARLGGRWYYDGSSGGGMTGDIWAEVGLRGEPGRLFARWEVFRFTNPEGTTGTTLGWGDFSTPITLGTTYTLFISYDDISNIFTFKIGSEEYTFGPTGLPARVGNSNMPYKGIGTRTQINGGASSGYLATTFDNVHKNGALYDDFSSASIDSTKWTNYEFVREISGGKLRSKARSSSAYTSFVNNELAFVNPLLIDNFKTKVTLVDYQNPQGLFQLAGISGAFYNDGTPGGGRIGDVVAEILIGGRGSNPGAGWRVYKYTNADGTTADQLASGSFITPVILGNTYTLSFGWNGSTFTFKFANEMATYTPATSINPVNVNFKRLRTIIYPEVDKKEATIEALFDDVKVNLPQVSNVDFDGDGKTDITVYRTNTGAWYVKPSGGGSPYGIGWGGDISDKPAPGDYDGDGKTDITVYRATTGAWYVYPSGGSAAYGFGWGGDAADKPAPGDYDGDGKTDIAVYRSSTGAWYVYPSGGSAPYGVGWGGDATDKPAPGDYDGDGKTDIAVYRSNTGAWYVYPSSGGAPYGMGWGGDATDKPVPGDYDGDGKADIAVYRAGTGAWYVYPSGGSAPYGVGWGGDATDKPVPGDYDGDGKTDITVYRATTGAWYVYPSGGGALYGMGWGGDASDKPVTTTLSSLD